jgi:hypothetical protein
MEHVNRMPLRIYLSIQPASAQLPLGDKLRLRVVGDAHYNTFRSRS